jgi:predicted CXXCH cytochrome family protein
MFRFLRRFVVAMVIAASVSGLVLVLARAQDSTGGSGSGTPVPGADPNGSCVKCHQNIFDAWQGGLHGKSISDPIFTFSWNEAGNPDACLVCHSTDYTATGQAKDGITCIECHSPIPANHPTDPVPVNNSPELCAKCHTDPRFTLENWQMSAHSAHGIECTTCHDPHSAGMKVIAGAGKSADASALCENCHKDVMKNFPLSQHAQAGVTCVNCHLGFNIKDPTVAPVDFSSVHKAPNHQFTPSLETCNKCHSNQMHAPAPAVAVAAIVAERAGGAPTAIPAAIPTPIAQMSTQAPAPSSLGIAAVAVLMGLAGGMVLEPWLDKAYRRFSEEGKQDKKDKEDKKVKEDTKDKEDKEVKND